ncbi:MAG: hypothetical protein WCS31_14535 [Verrucomicrobiae bacterium]
MIAGILIAIGTGLSWTIVGIVMTRISRHGLNAKQYFGLNSLFSLIFSLLSISSYKEFAEAGGWHANTSLCLLMVAAGAFNVAGLLALQRAMKLSHKGIAWSIGQSAIVLPFLAGILIFGQKGTYSQYAGGLLILGGMSIPSLLRKQAAPGSGANHKCLWLFLALAAFFLLGVSQTLTSTPSYWKGWLDHGNMRPALLYAGGFVASIALCLSERVNLFAWDKRTWLYAAGMAGLNMISIKLTFFSLDRLSASGVGSIGYPLLVGSCIAGFSLYSLLIIKEVSHPLNWVALAMTLAGIAAMTI